MNEVKVKVYRDPKLEDLSLPNYATDGSSGFDLVSSIRFNLIPKARVSIRTGLFFEIPKGYEIQIRSRSGLASKNGVIVLNQPGTLDSDYRGEVSVLLYNTSFYSYSIHKGDRIAQAILCPIIQAKFEEVYTLEELEVSERGTGGFGSSGR